MSFFKWGRKAYYTAMTETVNEWWSEIYKPSDFYDKIEIPLTVHLCGSEDIIESKASEIYGGKIDYPGTAGLAFMKGDHAHIFVIAARGVEFATTVINYFTAGHELAHIVDMINEKQGAARTTDYPNPDEFHT